MKLGIIGTGAYAIALASLFENKNIHITMWTKLEKEFLELKNNHTNTSVIDYKLKDNIKFTTSLEELSNNSNAIIIAVPAKFIYHTIKELKLYYQNQPLLIATKGMVQEENSLIHEFLEKELNTMNIACISGPSFAKDILSKHPIGLTLASKKEETMNYFQELFSDIPYLTIEKSMDMVGIEFCGILKNIIAIGSGILNGMNINSSSISKYLLDASKDIQCIIESNNGNPNCFYTYAGLGDYILTTTKKESRNYTFGMLLGEEKDFETYQKNTTIEGLDNLKGMYHYLKIHNIKSLIIEVLYKIIYLKESKNLLIDYLKKQE